MVLYVLFAVCLAVCFFAWRQFFKQFKKNKKK